MPIVIRTDARFAAPLALWVFAAAPGCDVRVWVNAAEATAPRPSASPANAVTMRTVVPLTREHWRTTGRADFQRREGFPSGLVAIGSGSIVARDVTFADGTIDVDVKADGDGFPGIRFRRRDENTSEIVYLRPGPDCRASDDCVQYAPWTHGVMLWDVMPQYQTSAPIDAAGWNHLRLVVNGRRLRLYVNGTTTPTLAVGRLEGDAPTGGIALTGPAVWANLTVTRGSVEGLPAAPLPDETDADPRYVRCWRVAPPATIALRDDASAGARTGVDPTFAQLPPPASAWRRIVAERRGFVDLSRLYGSKDRAVSIAWLRTRIDADRARVEHVRIGWTREIWVFANGRRVYAARNLYYSDHARKDPDGRLALENGSFDLPFRKGRNDVVVAIDDNFPPTNAHHYGWGFILRPADVAGLTFADARPGR